MNILGVADGLHAGAALTVNGKLVAVAHQQRLDRVAASNAFPWQAIEQVLEDAGVAPGDVDLVGVAGRFSPPFAVRRHPSLRALARDPFSPVHDARVFAHALLRHSGLGALEADRAGDWLAARFAERDIRPQRVILVGMHRALAEAAYRLQDDDTDVLVITLHPKGDGVALAVHVGNSAQLDRYWTQRGFASLHLHLGRCAATLGLRAGVDDARLWGLAGQGEPTEELGILLDRHLSTDGLKLSRRSYLVPARRKDRVYQALADANPADAAASIQANLRRTVVELVRKHVAHWGIRTVALGGQVFDNPRLVAAVAEMDEVERVLAGPEPGWGSLAIGAATMLAGKPPRIAPSLGFDAGTPTKKQIKSAVVALKNGQGVAHFSGRAGFGTEGQGSRAALVRADDAAAVERLRTALGRPEHEEPLVILLSAEADCFRASDKMRLPLAYGSAAPLIDNKHATSMLGALSRDSRARVCVASDGAVKQLLDGVAKHGIHALAAFPLAMGSEPTLSRAEAASRLAAEAGLHALVAGG
ncbi:MAG: hypothetical protein KC912_07395 [Proteobacteria bacterium]|nr:hypothetical protein [Pseudomonadota bacterium]